MRLRSRRRQVLTSSPPARPTGLRGAPPYGAPGLAGRARRCLRIGALVAVIAVRPRWKPLLAGTALTVFGIIEHSGGGGLAMMPGLMMLWVALLTPGDSAADHRRRQQLMSELAAFSTPAQRRDLGATLDQYPDSVTGEIRDALAGPAMAMRGRLPGAAR